MRSTCLRSAVVASTVTVATAIAAVASPSGASQSGLPPVTSTQLHASHWSYLTIPFGARVPARRAELASTVKVWKNSVTDGTTTFQFTMVGSDPSVHEASPSTTVKTVIVPVVIKVPIDRQGHYAVLDPTKPNGCDSVSPVKRTIASPIFAKRAYTWRGTKVGTTQYIDAFQRANFWQYTGPTGVNPGYHVLLSHVTAPAVTVKVPLADSAFQKGTCSGYVAAVNIDWWDYHLKHALFTSAALKALLTPAVLPIFVVEDTVWYQGSANTGCCILGYHSGFNRSGVPQTYAVASYVNDHPPFLPKPQGDVTALSHEIGEWMDDPYGNNQTLPWGNIGQVQGCQTNLEVGDPLSGHVLAIKVGTFTYHPQELAFFSWFYHESPSLGVNGWYSNRDTFTTSAAACP